MTLNQRQLKIAEGKAGLARHKVQSYRDRWSKRGEELPDIDWEAVPLTDDTRYITRPRPYGPGTELKKIFKSYGVPPCQFCNDLAEQMNVWGVQGCRRHLDEIANRIYEHSKQWAAEAEAEGVDVHWWQKAIASTPMLGKRKFLKTLVKGAIKAEEGRLSKKRVGGEDAVDASVVITCHNYGKYLSESIESVLSQSVGVRELLVVDDASDDDTASVVEHYASRGVDYARIESKSAWEARKYGYENTSGAYVCFLDADDMLSDQYVELAAFMLDSNWQASVIHTNIHKFGDEDSVVETPQRVTMRELVRSNHIHAGAVVRRSAVGLSCAFDLKPPDDCYEDWVLWQRVLSYGGSSLRSQAVYYYRSHGTQRSIRLEHGTWAQQAAVQQHRVSLLIPLSGRRGAWESMVEYLAQQEWPPNQIELIIGDTSQDEVFGGEVRSWLASCPYRDFKYTAFRAGRQGLADESRADSEHDVNVAMMRIWRRLVGNVSAEWVWCLEEDIVPPPDALSLLLGAFESDTDAVTAPYKSRIDGRYVLFGRDRAQITRHGKGVVPVASCGFGCVVIRSFLLQLHTWQDAGRWYDPWFFECDNKNVLCNWDIPCQHLSF